MNKNPEEKRNCPRVKTCLKVDISENICANSVNLSEGGLAFGSLDVFSSPTIALKIHFPDIKSDVKTYARLVWKRGLEDGTSVYGVEFVGLDEIQKTMLRKELLKAQVSVLLNEIKNPEIKKEIHHFFLTEVLGYINEIVKLSHQLPKEEDYSLELEERLGRLNNQLVLKGYCLEEQLSDKMAMQKAKDNFRHLLSTWVYKSAIVKRGFDKPRGYPGDYRMLEMIYDKKPISRGIGRYFDNYFLKNPYAVAVRTRKDRVKELLENYINGAALNKVNVLNIACGSCREIRELLPNLKTKSFVTFHCLDWDEEALKFSKEALFPVTPKNVEFKFIKEDVIGLIKDEKISELYDKQNLIYTIGLIDYLPGRVLKKTLCALYQLLQKEGRLIVTHKNKDKTFPPILPDWFCDWKFVARDREDIAGLFYNCGISDFSLSVESDDFGYVNYFTLTKK